jgi:hypothetical protein
VKKLVAVPVLMAIVPLLTFCQQSPKPSASPSPTKAVAERYQAVTNPSELGLDVQVAASEVSFGNDPGGAVEGKVTSLTIGGKELALTSPEIVQDDNGSWITTKDYGRIKIASGALGRGMVIYLKPSQKASLMKLYRETKSSK